MTSAERCPKCSAEARPGQLFCGRCGERVSQACPSCATLNTAGAAFCEQCGGAMAAPASTPPTAPTPPGRQSSGNSAACPRCRTVNEVGAAYCFNCGLPMESDSAQGPRLTPVSPYEGSTGARFPGMDAGIIDRPAGFWIRVVAYILDSLILGAVNFVIVFVFLILFLAVGITSIDSQGEEAAFAALLLIYLLAIIVIAVSGFFYHTLSVAIYSTTLGKKIVGVYILRPDGSRVGFGRAVARYFAPIISSFILYIGYIMVAFRQDKRSLHDLICDTVVVYKR